MITLLWQILHYPVEDEGTSIGIAFHRSAIGDVVSAERWQIGTPEFKGH